MLKRFRTSNRFFCEDSAYSGGNLTLSQAEPSTLQAFFMHQIFPIEAGQSLKVGQSLTGTFCSSCLVGIITAGDVSGPNSQDLHRHRQCIEKSLEFGLPGIEYVCFVLFCFVLYLFVLFCVIFINFYKDHELVKV